FGINVLPPGHDGGMTASGEFDTRPVRAFLPGPGLRVDEIRVSAWPASVPALAQVLRDGLELPAGLTVLGGRERVGEVHRGGDAGRGVRAEPAGRFGAGPVVPDQADRAGRGHGADRGARRPAALVVFPA